MKILAAGGGSGGHVTPVVAVLSELVKQTTLTDVHFVCDKAFATQAEGIMSHVDTQVSLHIISAGKLRRYRHFSWWHYIIHPSVMTRNIVDGGKIFIGTLQSLRLLMRHKPDVVFLKGGYVCLPVGFAAKLLHIPIVIHDSDARPGLTNRLLAPHATKIATGYPVENYPYDAAKTIYTGVPINEKFTTVTEAEQAKLKKRLDLSATTPLIVAFGGGLGAKAINEAVVGALPALAGVGVYTVIVAGKNNYRATLQAAEGNKNVTVLEFVSEGLVNLLGAADVVVARASATGLQELAGLGKPVIAVPAKALGDQHKNAAVFANAQAAIVMEDDEIARSGVLSRQLIDLLHDHELRTKLSTNIHSFAKPDAAKRVAMLLRDVAGGVH